MVLGAAPSFKVFSVAANGSVSNSSYSNVNDALGGVNDSVENINNRVSDLEKKVNDLPSSSSYALIYEDVAGDYNAGGNNNQPNKIVNVADGTVAEGSKDAVNDGQLWEKNNKINNIQDNVNIVIQ